MLPENLTIQVANVNYEITTEEYIQNKVVFLKEFGYPTVTAEEVREQVISVLEKKEWGQGLNVIGLFIQKDLLIQ
jgi:hypothetical protein